MQMVRIQIPDRIGRAKALEVLLPRNRVICLADNHFVVPEPALLLLQSNGMVFQEVGRGGHDYAEKALRDSLTAQIQ